MSAKSNGTEKESVGMDRRSFLKIGGLTAGIAAIAGSALVGCAPSTGSEKPETGAIETDAAFGVYDADILLIGGGYGGAVAMSEAALQGRRVLVVEKAPWGFGGGAGMNFDIMFGGKGEISDNTDFTALDSYIKNEQLFKNALLWSKDLENSPQVTYANWGEVFTKRNEDGTVAYYMNAPETMEHSFTRHYNDHFGAQGGITIHDKTMITNILVDEGKCVGAVGLHLPTGEYRVYRAKATIAAPGGCTQFYGWHTVSCRSNNTADNTADVEMAVMRRGGKICDAEFGAYDLMGIYPTGFACSNGSMVAGDSMHCTSLVDSDGKTLEDYGYDPMELLGNQDGVIRAVAAINDAGKGSENGGMYLRCTEDDIATMRLMYTRNIDLLKEKFGFDVTKEQIEVVPEMYEHGGAPVVDENAMSVDFPGLFITRGGGVTGSEGGNNTRANRRMGRYTMAKAIEYADSVSEEESMPFESAAEEIARLEELRTRTVEGRLRPVTVRRSIQKACANAMAPVRKQADLEAAMTELDRIMNEDLPKMACADDSRAYNVDWKDAIETINLLDMARVSVRASLDRQESRAALIRPEFPDTDDENWKCALAYTLGEDGSFSYEKIAY